LNRPDPSEDAFIAALFGEDELGVVVRAHIHIEARLLELLELLVEDPKHLERMTLDFSQRVHLATALGLKPEHAPGLLAFGSIRNSFAHRLDTQLSDDRINNLYKALSPGDKEAVQGAYEQTRVVMKGPDCTFKELGPKYRFALISVALRAMLLVAIREADDRQHRT